jgi:hypothetical protein
MTAEINKKKIRKSHHPDPWKQTGKWTKVFFYFLVLIAGILVAMAVFLVVAGD